VIKQLKILRTIISLSPLVKKFKKQARKIILYESTSRGEDTKG
jgi:hypothetical protein